MHADSPRLPEKVDRPRLIVSTLGSILAFVLLLFLPAGRWNWEKGWLFLFIYFGLGFLAAAYLWRVNPDIIAARANAHPGTKRWDKFLLSVFLPMVMAILPVAALDDGRFHWSRMPVQLVLLGYALLMAGLLLITWAEAVNRHFEPTVRIQSDRDHKVVDTGPYAYVRHPGYLSWLPMSAGMALALGSWWAFVPAILSVVLLVMRTRWEDAMLEAELPGYRAYSQRVRYRLLPGIW